MRRADIYYKNDLAGKLTETDEGQYIFEGLIPEGWLLDIASKNWKLNRNDRMGLLLACCQNCIGAVSVQPIIHDENTGKYLNLALEICK